MRRKPMTATWFVMEAKKRIEIDARSARRSARCRHMSPLSIRSYSSSRIQLASEAASSKPPAAFDLKQSGRARVRQRLGSACLRPARAARRRRLPAWSDWLAAQRRRLGRDRSRAIRLATSSAAATRHSALSAAGSRLMVDAKLARDVDWSIRRSVKLATLRRRSVIAARSFGRRPTVTSVCSSCYACKVTAPDGCTRKWSLGLPGW